MLQQGHVPEDVEVKVKVNDILNFGLCRNSVSKVDSGWPMVVNR